MTDSLDASEWRRAGALFHELVELDPAERSARLSSMGSDPALRRAVEALLAGDAIADNRLPQPGFGMLQKWSSADPLQLVGRTVSHFRVGEALASGGMGVVYRAEDLQIQRSVALKFLLPHYHLTDSSKERLLREARAVGGLDHPNVCAIYEIGESTAGLFLAMPLYRGETLKERLARTGTIPAEEALAIASQIAGGLRHAHAAGILHCDVKPGNVMLLPDGTAKILDFGLAKVRAESTDSHGALGTVSYMSPEQVRGEALDARTDLWALGVTLYEMLSGVRPFVGESAAAIRSQIETAEPRPLFELSPSVAPRVEALVFTLLQKQLDARYQAASDVADAIASIRNEAPVERPVRRRALSLIVAAGAGLVVLTSTAYFGFGPGRAPFDKSVIAHQFTSDTMAYDLFMTGRRIADTRKRELVDSAERLFIAATQRDPKFARAFSALADAYTISVPFHFLPLRQALELAENAADRAIELDPTLAEAHSSKGFVLMNRRGYHRAAEASFQKAIALEPGYFWAHHYYSMLLTLEGRQEDAERENRQSLVIEPLFKQAGSQHATLLIMRGDFPAARVALDSVLAHNPGFPVSLYYRGIIDVAAGHYAEALVSLEQAHQGFAGFSGLRSALAYTYTRLGQTANARRMMAELRAAGDDDEDRIERALGEAVMGNIDGAYDALQNVDWDFSSTINLQLSPLLSKFRQDRRYAALLGTMKLDP